MRVILDTNVFVSGVFWKGTPAKILEAWIDGQFQIVVSMPILEEYSRVLKDLGRKTPEVDVDRILALIGLHAEMVKPVRFARPVCRDRDDDKFLEAAIGGGVSYVVSGDKDLLDTNGKIESCSVMKPSEFWAQLKTKSK